MKYLVSLIGAFVLSSSGVTSSAAPHAAAPLKDRSYIWYGQLIAVDEQTRTATIKAHIPALVEKYVDRFKPGDRLVLVWDMIGKTEAQRALALWNQEQNTAGNTGYVLPIEFVSADAPSHMVTFYLRVPKTVLDRLRSVEPGQWIKVTTPMIQPSQDATMTSIEQAAPPQESGEAPPPA